MISSNGEAIPPRDLASDRTKATIALICRNNSLTGMNMRTFSQECNEVARCTSTAAGEVIDTQWELVNAISYFHVTAIILTVVFNLLQNIFSIFDVTETYKFPIAVAYCLIVLDLIGTTIQNLWARSLKVVEIPRHLTFVQSAFVETIEKELLKFKKHDAIQDLVILVSSKEYKEICEPLSPLQKKIQALYYLFCFSTPPENNFDKTLQIIAKRHHKDFRLHILRTDDTNTISTLLTEILPPDFLPNSYKILAYSPEHSSLQISHVDNIITPNISLKRALFSTTYFNEIYAEGKFFELSKYAIKQIPALLFLKFGPALCTMLQGPATLSAMLGKFGLKDQTNFYVRFAIIFFGCVVGFFKTYVTFMIKTEIAEERLSYCFNSIRLPKPSDIYLTTQLAVGLLQLMLLPVLCVLYLPYYLIRSFCKPNNKMWLNTALYLDPVFDKIIQLLAPFGTAYFYAGFGFFFSGSGLIYIAETFSIPMPAEDNYTNASFLVFRIFSCLSQVFLNAIFNQGWDVMAKSSASIEQKKQEITENLQALNQQDLLQPLILTEVSEFRPNNKDAEPDIFWQRTILCCVLIDSFVFGLSAMAGTSKADDVGANLAPGMFNASMLLIMPIVVGLGIFASQIIYSLVLGERDGEKLWKMIGQQYTPRFIKDYVRMQHSVLYPATTTAKFDHEETDDLESAFAPVLYTSYPLEPLSPYYGGSNY